MKKSKLKIEKFRVLNMKSLSTIVGGTGTVDPGIPGATATGGTDGNSETTTYTTDPNVACPNNTTTDTTATNTETSTTATTITDNTLTTIGH